MFDSLTARGGDISSRGVRGTNEEWEESWEGGGRGGQSDGEGVGRAER